MKKIKQVLLRLQIFINSVADKIILPGFKGFSLLYVGSFFIKGIQEGAISMRASSVAYSFFIAVFPTLIFIFGLIPFIPIENFQQELFEILSSVLPESAYTLMHETILDTIMTQRTSILSIGFFLMLFFSSNGVIALIDAFNNTYHEIDTRKAASKRLIAIVLVVIMSLLLFIAITLIVIGNKFFIDFISQHPKFEYSNWIYLIVGLLKWLIVLLLYFMVISFLYFLAPAKKSRFQFITPGAIFATVLQIITSLGFSYYVNNFAQYNKLYGSIGTVIVVMLLFYITALALILGFELNVSILSGKKINYKKNIKH